jgi:hypothetical protein
LGEEAVNQNSGDIRGFESIQSGWGLLQAPETMTPSTPWAMRSSISDWNLAASPFASVEITVTLLYRPASATTELFIPMKYGQHWEKLAIPILMAFAPVPVVAPVDGPQETSKTARTKIILITRFLFILSLLKDMVGELKEHENSHAFFPVHPPFKESGPS